MGFYLAMWVNTAVYRGPGIFRVGPTGACFFRWLTQ